MRVLHIRPDDHGAIPWQVLKNQPDFLYLVATPAQNNAHTTPHSMNGAFVGDGTSVPAGVPADEVDGCEIAELPSSVPVSGVPESCEGTKRVTETVFTGSTGTPPDEPPGTVYDAPEPDPPEPPPD